MGEISLVYASDDQLEAFTDFMGLSTQTEDDELFDLIMDRVAIGRYTFLGIEDELDKNYKEIVHFKFLHFHICPINYLFTQTLLFRNCIFIM